MSRQSHNIVREPICGDANERGFQSRTPGHVTPHRSGAATPNSGIHYASANIQQASFPMTVSVRSGTSTPPRNAWSGGESISGHVSSRLGKGQFKFKKTIDRKKLMFLFDFVETLAPYPNPAQNQRHQPKAQQQPSLAPSPSQPPQ